MCVKKHVYGGSWMFALVLLTGLLPQAIRAQDLPPLDAAYVDSDPAALRITAIDAEDTAQLTALESTLRREPRNVVARLQNAQYLVDRGMRARVPRELAAAERAAPEDSVLRRSVHFNAGWMHYRMGDFDAARNQWLQAWRQHGGHPDWVPIAFALTLWSQGDRETALAYFQAAVSARPEQWGSAEAVEASASALGANEQFVLQSMHQAAVGAAR